MLSKAAVLASVMAVPAMAANITVLVGQGGLNYVPANVNASIGDLITFEFVNGNHNVVQSSFSAPCVNLPTNATTNATGLDSGYFPVNASATSYSTWTINVTSLNPIWYYCSQGSHCQAGMVGAINANNATYASFKAAALASTNTTKPVTTNNTVGGVGASVVGNGMIPKANMTTRL